MKITADNFFTTSDGIHIYFEDRGSGLPIVMVPGFLCTTKFFEKNAEVLSKEFRVITMDLRGQGNSSKTCQGNTIRRNAQDIKELIDHLGLEHVVLLGWSLASSIVVSYAAEFEQYKLNGLVTMDGSLYPFSDADWNHHRGRDYNLQNWFDTYLPLTMTPSSSMTNSSPAFPVRREWTMRPVPGSRPSAKRRCPGRRWSCTTTSA